jgi:hypothetical protein
MANKISYLLVITLFIFAQTQTDIFSQYYQQAKKIAEAMTIDQLVGQMIQADL